MKLKHIIDSKNKDYGEALYESWSDLTNEQKLIIETVNMELIPLLNGYKNSFLIEASLTNKEILATFKSAINHIESNGDDRTSLGKAKDAAALPVKALKAIDAKVMELGKKLQDTTPIKNMDARFEELKKEIASKNADSKVIKAVQRYSDWAKANPGKSSFVVGVLTTISAVLAGPLGGAAAGALIGAVDKLIKGEKLSTAVGSSMKTALYGYLVGLAFRWISKEILESISAANSEQLAVMKDSLENANVEAVKTAALENNPLIANALDAGGIRHVNITGHINKYNYFFDVYMNPEQAAKYKELSDVAVNAARASDSFSKEAIEATLRVHDYLATVQSAPDQSAYRAAFDVLSKMREANVLTPEQIATVSAVGESMVLKVKALAGLSDVIAGIVQGSVQQAKEIKDNMMKVSGPIPDVKESVEVIDENIIGDTFNKVKTAGENLTNEVTLDKLIKVWEKKGKPTDTEDIIDLLGTFDIDAETAANLIKNSGKDEYIITDKIQKMDLYSKSEIIEYIKQKLA